MTQPQQKIFDCLIFDLDGTLSDPALGFCRSINYALAHHEYEPIDDEILKRHIGPPIDRTFTALLGPLTADRMLALVTSYRERYAEAGYTENKLYDGMADTIALLAGAGVRLGVCTSKRADFAEKILDHFSLHKYFAFVNGGDIGMNKAQQLAALLAAKTITAQAVMIGDRDVDLVAARENGLASAGVLWGYGSKMELEKENPDFLFSASVEIQSLVHLPEFNRQLRPHPTSLQGQRVA